MKKKLREEALVKRNGIPAEERAEKSRKAAEYILQSDAFQKAKQIFTFVSMGSEIETGKIMEAAWKEGKIVAVPKTEKRRVMYFIPIDSFDDLQEGRFGVMEPKGTAEDAIVTAIDDLFHVPGALFDRKKNRIGYGGGFYGRFLEKEPNHPTVALCYDFQVFPELQTQEHDIPVDLVLWA